MSVITYLNMLPWHVIHEINALREVFGQWVGKFLVKSIIALWCSQLLRCPALVSFYWVSLPIWSCDPCHITTIGRMLFPYKMPGTAQPTSMQLRDNWMFFGLMRGKSQIAWQWMRGQGFIMSQTGSGLQSSLQKWPNCDTEDGPLDLDTTLQDGGIIFDFYRPIAGI